MVERRITDPATVTDEAVQAILDQGGALTLQFSAPCYTPSLLGDINRLCAKFRERLEVRFFGHYGEVFDADVLRHMPEVRHLSVDGLSEIRNEEAIWALPSLERLSFGVYRFNRPDFLSGFGLERMTALSLSETARRDFDLGPLARCAVLADLFVQGHARNIEVIGGLPRLERLRLSGTPGRVGLSFVKAARQLRSLTLLLGSRESVDEMEHLGLSDLQIVWVRGLTSIGNLARFPALQRLSVEDQLQLKTMSLIGPSLREFSVHNCKNLTDLVGLDEQTKLESLRISRTKLDLDALAERHWPASMDVLALYSSSEKWNKATRVKLDARGYREFRRTKSA